MTFIKDKKKVTPRKSILKGSKWILANFFFCKIRIISLSRPKPIGSALGRAGPKKQKQKKDISKLDSRGFKMDSGENFFEKRIISLSRPKPIGSALRRAGPNKVYQIEDMIKQR